MTLKTIVQTEVTSSLIEELSGKTIRTVHADRDILMREDFIVLYMSDGSEVVIKGERELHVTVKRK